MRPGSKPARAKAISPAFTARSLKGLAVGGKAPLDDAGAAKNPPRFEPWCGI